MKSVFITGADRGLGLSLCKEFLSRDWQVFAVKFMEDYFFLEELREKNSNLHIVRVDLGREESIFAAADEVAKNTDVVDMLISNAALMNKVECKLYDAPMDLDAPWNSFNVNALGPLRLTRAFLPLMRGGERRLCYVSSEVSCINLMKTRFIDDFPYPMSKAAMNMGVRLLHNELFPQGYTFRLFHPGWMKFREQNGELAKDGKYDPDVIGEIAAKYFETPLGDENRLVMVDYDGYEWPW
ncbi:MAG: SDR family NAD(P)-dependent oxidoreductase [Defluviitaleaceae bacterium]|nr:SDR family NAD(P)-dependent oxidoreductase [Defluviitaleaceae bacterium]